MSKGKVKKESKLKEKIREMKKTAKGRAILKLIGYGIFFFVLFVIAIISTLLPQPEVDVNEINNRPPVTDTEENANTENILLKAQNDLLNKNYDYTYEININENKYTYEGNKNDKVDKGYKTSSSEIIKYYIDDTGIYRDLGTEKNLIDNLYQDINKDYIDLKYILNILKPEKLVNLTKEDEKAKYEYSDNENKYTFAYNKYKENSTYEVTITIVKENNYSYTLSYRNVGSN